MTPQEHIEWIQDNVSWFESLDTNRLDVPVPNCPGWTVADVLNHLTFGVGRSYPAALSAPPETAAKDVFAAVGRPSEYPRGSTVLPEFSTNMHRCIEVFESANPETPCWTYAGSGTAAFWFRRAAIETTLHGIDVEETLNKSRPLVIQNYRVLDAIAETLEFALPLALQLTDQPGGRLTAVSPELGVNVELGEGSRHSTVEGNGKDLLLALWGRHRNRIRVSGDQDIAAAWLSLIESAFAGR